MTANPRAQTSLTGIPKYQSITYLTSVTKALETHLLFSGSAKAGLSPIDEFIGNTDVLNTLASGTNGFTREFSTVLLLGYMSAVESFIRALIRELVNIDEVAQKCAEPKVIPFGAAISHERRLLAESLLEGVSFAGRKGVTDALKDFLGIKNIAEDMGTLFDEYEKICEIRHCCVHRFGKLGAKNAISLGLDAHKKHLEKPLSLDSALFQELALRLRTFAKSLNNVVCTRILDRMATNKDDKGKAQYTEKWTWNEKQDRKRFRKYYRIFASKNDAMPSPSQREVYESFRARNQSKAGP